MDQTFSRKKQNSVAQAESELEYHHEPVSASLLYKQSISIGRGRRNVGRLRTGSILHVDVWT